MKAVLNFSNAKMLYIFLIFIELIDNLLMAIIKLEKGNLLEFLKKRKVSNGTIITFLKRN